MKKYVVLVFVIIFLFTFDVQAEGMPIIIAHKVMVTNKEGTACYINDKKDDRVIPYKTILTANYDIVGSYINVINDEYDCYVKYSDVSSNSQKFSINDQGVKKITSIRAIVLPTTGLNMRIGPSVTYKKVVTIPQNTILVLTHKAGTYWYYTRYNDKEGWITAMNNYIGFDENKVLINYDKTKLYSANGVTVNAIIPENTIITDYIKLAATKESDFKYYVNYMGKYGYLKDMLYKVDNPGKIRLKKDVELKDEKGNPIKRMSSGSELEYTMIYNNSFYFPEKKSLIELASDEFEYIKEAKILVKDRGYIGEGLFGEEKMEREVVPPTPTPEKEEKKEDNRNIKDIIIICLLAGILITLVVLIVIKLMNNKKSKIVNNKEV